MFTDTERQCLDEFLCILAFEQAAQDRQDHLLPEDDRLIAGDVSAPVPFLLKQPRNIIDMPERYLHPKCVHRDCSNAIIRIYRKTEPYRYPIFIWFEISATGDFFLEEGITEKEQWMNKRGYTPVQRLVPKRRNGSHGDHEWYAARKHAVKAIAQYRKKHGPQLEGLPSSTYV